MKPAVQVIELPTPEGYPDDYVVARVCGRRSTMLGNWDALLMAARPALPARYAQWGGGGPEDAVDRTLKRELWWAARQMNDRLREVFHPVYVYFELGTLFSSIRYRARRDTEEAVERTLEMSLLSPALKEAIKKAASPAEAVKAAEMAFAASSTAYRDVAGAPRLADAEQGLTDIFLGEAAAGAPHPVIRGFFRAVIDMRNIVSAYKRLRWGTGQAPPLLEGGNIKTSRIRGLASEAALFSALKGLTGLAVERPSDMDRLFLGRLLAYSREAARSAGAVGVVLDYLLRCHAEARNLRLLLAGRALDRELLRSELVT